MSRAAGRRVTQGQTSGSDRRLEPGDVSSHGGGSSLGVAVADRLEQLAMFAHRLVETCDAVECDQPDPESEHVVPVERLLEERIVCAAVDMPVETLIELDQCTLVVTSGRRETRREAVRSRRDPPRCVVRRRARRPRSRRWHAPRRGLPGHRLRRSTRTCPDARGPRRDSRARAAVAPRAREYGRSGSGHQRSLVDERARRQLERDDQLADAVVRLVRERPRLVGLRLEEWQWR